MHGTTCHVPLPNGGRQREPRERLPTGSERCRQPPRAVSPHSALARPSVASTSNDGTVHSAAASSASPLSRAEAALCLVPELALQQPDALRSHLPTLLLIAVIKADASHAAVHGHAQQVRLRQRAACSVAGQSTGRCGSSRALLLSVRSARRRNTKHARCRRSAPPHRRADQLAPPQVLEHIVHAMAAQALPEAGMPDRQAAARALLAELQASTDAPLWPAEVTSVDSPVSATYPAVQRLVQQLVDVIFFEAELQVKWVRPRRRASLHAGCGGALPADRALEARAGLF